jgi:chromosome segregation ATPase
MADTAGDLARLEQEERAVSQRRRRLHERIDFIRGSGAQDEDSLERLAKLQLEEKEVSSRRRELHARIDALRSQVGTGASPGPQPKERLLEAPGRDYLTAMQIGFGSLTRDEDA